VLELQGGLNFHKKTPQDSDVKKKTFVSGSSDHGGIVSDFLHRAANGSRLEASHSGQGRLADDPVAGDLVFGGDSPSEGGS
jgi:hypothetical protein